MDWKDILILLGLIGFAATILYRTVRKKKWCPAVFGSRPDDTQNETSKLESESS